jgi:hypothetical protein
MREVEAMSLYNALFDTTPYADALLMMLGINAERVPRFRDCYLNKDGEIVILTRTGGGNRADYEAENAALRAVAGFINDADDDFDSTYASFIYAPPPGYSDVIAEIAAKQGDYDPMATFRQTIADLQAGKDTPATRRAMEVGKDIFKRLEAGEKIIKV